MNKVLHYYSTIAFPFLSMMESDGQLIHIGYTNWVPLQKNTQVSAQEGPYITILGQTGMTYNAGFSQANILMSVTANPRGHRSMIVNKKNYKN
ncbi:MAG: hypothetical protein CSH49_10175 [Alcanivorax sp.]|nr:MAG: hypothetical protein D9N13_22635 [Ketobacter sp. GenoA1]RLT96462.1 MAG: hypothetical protein D9N15_10135 [Ketobacter sp.]TNC88764.1 MAG: hypothetical protein CSH49_10175 [Alcanivorax sp.]